MNTTETSSEERTAQEEGREEELRAFARALEIEHGNAPFRAAGTTAQHHLSRHPDRSAGQNFTQGLHS